MRTPHHGFTLIEMVVVIVISAIVVGFVAMFLVTPVNAFIAQQRRIEMSDSADNAMRMIEDDVRRAVPDSVRVIAVGTSRTIELLSADVARYSTNPTDGLVKTGDNSFSAIGCFLDSPTGLLPGNYFLVVGHGAPGANAYDPVSPVRTSLANRITVGALCVGSQAIALSQNFSFPTDSTNRRVYLVSSPVAYVCNLTTGTVKRFERYTPAANQASRATEAQLLANGASSALVAQNVTSCVFNPILETPYVSGLVRVRMTFTRDAETFQAFDEVQVENRR